MKHEIIGFIGIYLFGVFCTLAGTLPSDQEHHQNEAAYQDTIQDLRNQLDTAHWYLDTNTVICLQLCEELEGWRDHGNRFRLILDIPDTLEMSYAVKCAYSIDTRRLVGIDAIYLKPDE